VKKDDELDVRLVMKKRLLNDTKERLKPFLRAALERALRGEVPTTFLFEGQVYEIDVLKGPLRTEFPEVQFKIEKLKITASA
jgi:hypothetical protein